MAGKSESPQKAAMRDMMHSYLKDNDIRIKNGASEKLRPFQIYVKLKKLT